MDLFYDPEFSEAKSQLNLTESHHCLNVLRKRTGDSISVTNGKGNIWDGLIEQEGKLVKVAEIKLVVNIPSPPLKAVAMAPPKSGDRLEWYVEKATELGVSDMFFFQSERSERRKINLDRLQKKAISAIKQSHNPFLPRIHDIKKWNDILTGIPVEYTNRYIAHTSDTSTSKKLSPYLVLIGPEGGFTNEEVESALKHGFEPLSLGSYVLRTETAGVVALV